TWYLQSYLECDKLLNFSMYFSSLICLTVKPVVSPTTLSGGEEYFITKYLKVKPLIVSLVKPVAYLSMS
ncbi:MAG: hypothetical protein ACC651_09475, partial [Candidatus Scalindua sp.]